MTKEVKKDMMTHQIENIIKKLGNVKKKKRRMRQRLKWKFLTWKVQTQRANTWKGLSNGFELAEELANMKTEQYIMQLEEN